MPWQRADIRTNLEVKGGRIMITNYEQKDAELFAEVQRLKAGNAQSYNRIYELSEKYIYKIINDIVKNHHTTEDLMQETYMQIYNKIGTLQEAKAFYVWAGRIATNLTLRHIQKYRKEVLVTEDEEGGTDFVFDTAAADHEAFIPESILMDREKQRLLGEILDNLSVEQKLCVQYFYYEEMSVREIANAMSCSEGTVKSRLNYARKSIKDAVEDLAAKQGTKLYSLSAMPLFWLLFRSEVEHLLFGGVAGGASAGASIGVTGTQTAGASIGAAGAATSATAGTAVATTTGMAAFTKALIAVISVVTIGTGGYVAYKATKNDKPAVKEEVEVTQEVTDIPVPEEPVAIIEDPVEEESIAITQNPTEEEAMSGYMEVLYEDVGSVNQSIYIVANNIQEDFVIAEDIDPASTIAVLYEEILNRTISYIPTDSSQVAITDQVQLEAILGSEYTFTAYDQRYHLRIDYENPENMINAWREEDAYSLGVFLRVEIMPINE